jgi:hypothetical protein
MATRGGKRQGSGRKEGSQNLPKLSSFFTDKELLDYVTHLKKRYKKSDIITKFVGEQLFGKAPQPLVGNEGGPIKIESVEIIVRK